MSRWEDRALCVDMDTEVFYPDRGQSCDEARQTCRRCPVQAECLADVLAWEAGRTGDPHGFVGGKTAKERELMLGRRPGRAKGKTPATRAWAAV